MTFIACLMPAFMKIVILLTSFALLFQLPAFFLTTEHLTAIHPFSIKPFFLVFNSLISSHLLNINSNFIASGRLVLNMQADSNTPTLDF